MHFSKLFWLEAFCGYLLWFLEINTKFFRSNCTTLLLRSKPVQHIYLCFLKKHSKTVSALRINETTLTQEKAFIVDIFPLGKGKNENMRNYPLLGLSKVSLGLQKTHIFVFLNYSSSSHFLTICCYFQKLKLSLLNTVLNFK